MWGVDVATCSSSCSLLLARFPPGGSPPEPAAAPRPSAPGRGRAGAFRALAGGGGTVEGGGRTPRGPSPPPVPPREWAGLPGRGRAGAGSGSPQRGPRPAGRRSGGRPRRRPRPHGEQDAIADPAAPPGFSPTPPTTFPVVVGLGWHAQVAPPHPPSGGGGGRGGAPRPPPGEGWQGAGGGVAPRRGWRGDGGGWGGWRTLTNLLGAVRVGASLSLARGDAVGSWGGVLVGQSAKKKMSSSPRGSGQRGARR